MRTPERYISFQSHGNLTAFTLLGILSSSFCSHSEAYVRSNIYVASEGLARSVQACQDFFHNTQQTTSLWSWLYAKGRCQGETMVL